MKIGIIHMYPSNYLLESYVDLGYEVFLFSPCDPGLDSVKWQYDPFESEEFRLEKLVSFGRFLKIDIFPAVYEGAVEIVAAVSEKLKLPSFSIESARASRNKYLAYKSFDALNVPTPKTVVVKLKQSKWSDVTMELGCPVIIKLADSMNSQGVIKVDSEETFQKALYELTKLIEQPETLDYSIDRNRVAYGKSSVNIIAQEYLSGIEFSVDLVFKNFDFLSLGVFEKLPPFGSTFVESASISPPDLSENNQKKVVELATKALSSIGADVGSAHVEIMKTEKGFFLIEVGLRPGGGFTAKCIELLHGVNPFQALVEVLSNISDDLALLDRFQKDQGFVMFGGVHYRVSGRIKNIIGLDILSNSPMVQDYIILNKIGDDVLAAPNSSQPHLTYYLIKAKSRKEALDLHFKIQKTVQVEIDSEREIVSC